MAGVEPRRCELCGTAVALDVEGGQFVFANHTPDFCRGMTIGRLKTYQEIIDQSVRDQATQEGQLIELGAYLQVLEEIIDAGRGWLAERGKRAEDLGRLRKAFGTNEARMEHPLWRTEEDVAQAVAKAVEAVDRKGAS
jgi:hypothetical protein